MHLKIFPIQRLTSATCMSLPMTYRWPAGGGGIVTPAVAAKSSKSFGRRWLAINQRTRHRFNALRSACPSVSAMVSGCHIPCGGADVPVEGCVDGAIWAPVEDDSATGDCFLLQPQIAKASSPIKVNALAHPWRDGLNVTLIRVNGFFNNSRPNNAADNQREDRNSKNNAFSNSPTIQKMAHILSLLSHLYPWLLLKNLWFQGKNQRGMENESTHLLLASAFGRRTLIKLSASCRFWVNNSETVVL